ncbi:hypothetical protein J2S55_005815 [Streptosporangium brasiliense]|uniref:Uncharacterized protein n=1 Tax=Streptosporangium brasiliense TaxID=47480 RepID=A0ABT9RBB3_9ACTN|nr:hypothetical protein [Streptosporangium brasiliense]
MERHVHRHPGREDRGSEDVDVEVVAPDQVAARRPEQRVLGTVPVDVLGQRVGQDGPDGDVTDGRNRTCDLRIMSQLDQCRSVPSSVVLYRRCRNSPHRRVGLCRRMPRCIAYTRATAEQSSVDDARLIARMTCCRFGSDAIPA